MIQTSPVGRQLRPRGKLLQEDARRHHRSLLLQQLFREGPASRADLARTSGLTRVTVSDLVGELVADGLVEELGAPAESRVGKPPTLVGLAFWTTELEPLERGYDGPIKMLVGLDTRGILAGVIVAEHHEPYGNFSIDVPRFPAQLTGKSVRDPFKVGGDVDAVSRATITMSSAATACRWRRCAPPPA